MPKQSKLPQRYRRGFLTKISRKTTLGRELNETFAAVVNDAGGIDAMTTGSLMLCERLTFLDTMTRAMEREIAKDPVAKPELVGRWVQAVNSMQGLIKTLRLDRDRRDDVLDALYADDSPDIAESTPETPQDATDRDGMDGKASDPNAPETAPERP